MLQHGHSEWLASRVSHRHESKNENHVHQPQVILQSDRSLTGCVWCQEP